MANEVGKAQCWNPSGIVVYRGVFNGVWFVTSSFEKDMIQGDNPVVANYFTFFIRHFWRVELFGNAAQSGW